MSSVSANRAIINNPWSVSQQVLPANFPGLWPTWGLWSCPPASSAGFPSSSRRRATWLQRRLVPKCQKTNIDVIKKFVSNGFKVYMGIPLCSWLMAVGLFFWPEQPLRGSQPTHTPPEKTPPDRNSARWGEKYSTKQKQQNNSQESVRVPKLVECACPPPRPPPPLANKFGFKLATVTREFHPFQSITSIFSSSNSPIKVWTWRLQQQAAGRFLWPPSPPLPFGVFRPRGEKCSDSASWGEEEEKSRIPHVSPHPVFENLAVLYPQSCLNSSERAIVLSLLPRWIFNKRRPLPSLSSPRIFASAPRVRFVVTVFGPR